jgi:sugar phosphate isomerase/epimerase
MSDRVLSMNLATLRNGADFGEMVDDCLHHGITAIAPWRDQIEAVGLAEAVRIVEANELLVSSLCLGGMFPSDSSIGRQKIIEDNLRAIDEAAALSADCLVLVVGGLPEGSKDLAGARQMVADGIWAMVPYAKASGVPLAIEPLHPMYAADRSCVSTLDQALDLCEMLGGQVGVAIDVYHTWWDPGLAAAIERAGQMNRIFAHQISDWLVPTTDLQFDRGMMGDGVIDLKAIRGMIERAGYTGPQEVEILSRDNWWTQPGDEVVATCLDRFEEYC